MEPIISQLDSNGFYIAPSMRGFGKTTYNNNIESFDDLSNDINHFMESTFPNIKNYYIFGHNIGGIVAMNLA